MYKEFDWVHIVLCDYNLRIKNENKWFVNDSYTHCANVVYSRTAREYDLKSKYDSS